MLSEDSSQLRASGILWHCTSTCKQLLALLNHAAATLVCEEKEKEMKRNRKEAEDREEHQCRPEVRSV